MCKNTSEFTLIIYLNYQNEFFDKPETQWWFIAGSASQTVNQHKANIEPMGPYFEEH